MCILFNGCRKRHRKYCYSFGKCNEVKVKKSLRNMNEIFVLCTCHLWYYKGIFLLFKQGNHKKKILLVLLQRIHWWNAQRGKHTAFSAQLLLHVKCEVSVWVKRRIESPFLDAHTQICATWGFWVSLRQCHDIYIKVRTKWKFNTFSAQLLKCEVQQPLVCCTGTPVCHIKRLRSSRLGCWIQMWEFALKKKKLYFVL